MLSDHSHSDQNPLIQLPTTRSTPKAFTGTLHVAELDKHATALHTHSHGMAYRIRTLPGCFTKHHMPPWDTRIHTNNKKHLKLRSCIHRTVVSDRSKALRHRGLFEPNSSLASTCILQVNAIIRK